MIIKFSKTYYPERALLHKHQWDTKSACFQRRDLLCNHNVGDLFTCEDMKFFGGNLTWYFTGVYIINNVIVALLLGFPLRLLQQTAHTSRIVAKIISPKHFLSFNFAQIWGELDTNHETISHLRSLKIATSHIRSITV